MRDYQQYERWKTTLGKDNLPKSLADFQELKYNKAKEFELMEDYKFSIENGKLSPNVDYNLFKTTKTKVEQQIVGLTTSNGIEIKSQSKHFVERVLGSVEQRRCGVGLEDIKKCLTEGTSTPIKIREDGKKSQTYILIGRAEVTINPDNGNLIQTNPEGK